MVAISRICPWGGGCSTNQTQAPGLASKDVVRELRTLFGRSHPGAVGQLDDLFFCCHHFFGGEWLCEGFSQHLLDRWSLLGWENGSLWPGKSEFAMFSVKCPLFWGLWSGLDGDCWNLKIFASQMQPVQNGVISLHATRAWVKIRKRCRANAVGQSPVDYGMNRKLTAPSLKPFQASKEEGGLLPGCLWRRFGSCLFVLWSGFGHLAPEQHRRFFFFCGISGVASWKQEKASKASGRFHMSWDWKGQGHRS